MLQYAVPPGYQRQQPIKRPKLGPWLGVIDAILEDDKQRPAKQRHTAKRIFERLKEEHGFTGGYTIVKDYVRSAELHNREMFIPLTHAPGEAHNAASQVHISFRIEAQPAPVLADQERILQVLNELVANAIKFSQPETVIHLAAQPSGPGEVCLIVEDQGRGIAPEKLERIFDHFQ
jgi:signal transduction histidine kinase